MNREIFWLPDAIAELDAAAERYANIRLELGLRFASEIEKAISAIAGNPLRFAIVDQDVRRAQLRRFPHGIFFRSSESRIEILACFHGRRNPEIWRGR